MNTGQVRFGKQAKQAQRFKRAVVIVALLAAVLLAVCFIPKLGLNTFGKQTDSADGSYVATLTGNVLSGVDIQTGLADAGFAVTDDTLPPEWFEQEVMALDELDSVMATPDWSTVGFYMQGSVSEVSETLCKEFSEKGWQGYASGIDGAATYMKEEGVCTWMMASCIEIEDLISVVLRIQHT